jgi:hypothetical protein
MARRDTILISFLSHPLIRDKYEITGQLPQTVAEGLLSKEPIVKAISLIVDNLESSTTVTDSALRILINQYLNSAAI